MNWGKILKSGIFKLDDNGEPIGIFKLTRNPGKEKGILPGGRKALSEKYYHPLNKKEIPGLIGNISYEIDRMTSKPDTNVLFKNMISIHELELKTTLFIQFGFSEVELNPQLKQLIQKMRKVYKKKFERGEYPGLTGPKSQAYESAMWINVLIAVLGKYIVLNQMDAMFYISHILRSTGIEKGNIDTIFERIKKRCNRKQFEIEKNNQKMRNITAAISRLK